MGILQFISRVCVQTAVYWGTGVEDGYGKKTFATPREVLVRWEDKTVLHKDKDGKETTTIATVMVQEDMELGGLLYLGSLNTFSPLELEDPYALDNVYEITAFDKIPLFRSTDKFVRKVYLSAR